MRKTLNKFLIILVMMLVILMVWTGTANAANISVSSTGSVTVGGKVSVTVNFGEKMKAAQFVLNYDASKLDFVSVSAGTYGADTKAYMYINMSDVADLSSVTFTFNSKATGAASFSTSGFILSNAKQDGVTPTISNTSTSTTIKAKPTPKPDPEPDTKPDPKPDTKPDSKPNTDNKPTFSSVNQKVYAKESVSIRDSWSTSGKLLGTLQKNSSITRTGIGSNGWDRVTYNGKTAYISHQYLTTTKPNDKDDKKDDEKDKNNTTNEVSNNTTNNETENNTTNNEIANNETNDVVNNETNEATNTQTQGNTDKDKKGFNINTIEIIIIAVIVLAIIVIIINEILAKKREERRREAKKRDEKRVKGSRR